MVINQSICIEISYFRKKKREEGKTLLYKIAIILQYSWVGKFGSNSFKALSY